jgi:hypothetical protein
MKKMNEGDLVYIPSGVTLFSLDEHGSPRKAMKLSRPTNLLITEINEDTYKVLYGNEAWLVKKNKTYEVTQ